MAPLPTRFRIILDETVKALAFCLVLHTFSVVTTDASLLVPSSTNDLNNSMWQSPRRGKEDAFEKQIAGRWHVTTLQEASEKVDHDILTGRFHVTHYGGCAILFNKDTFNPNIDVKSIYLHDTRRGLPDQVMEGEQGWVMQGILSRASFRRPPLSGQETFTVLSLHVSNIYAKKRGIAKKLILTIRAVVVGQQIDVVAGDFMKPWQTVHCQRRRALYHCGDPVRFQTTGLTSVDSLSHRCSDRYWKVLMHGAFSIPRKTLGLRPTDQSLPSWDMAPPGFSSIGAALGHSMMSMTDEFYSRSVLRRTSTASRKGESATS